MTRQRRFRAAARPILSPGIHEVLKTRIGEPFPAGMERAIFGMGCFWGAERIFWQPDGRVTTAVGYAGGFTPNPTYEEVCSGRTGHAEVVLVVFDPARTGYGRCCGASSRAMTRPSACARGTTWAPSTGRRSTPFRTPARRPAVATRDRYAEVLAAAGLGRPTTEIAAAGPFYYAEEYHQQYLAKVPDGYCGLGGTGVICPVGVLGDGHPEDHDVGSSGAWNEARRLGCPRAASLAAP